MKGLSVIVAAMALFLSSCDEEVSPKEAAVRQEVSKRVETIREELKDDQDRRFTVRVVAFSLLAGCSLIALLKLGADGRWFPLLGGQGTSASSIQENRPANLASGRRVIESPGAIRPPRQQP